MHFDFARYGEEKIGGVCLSAGQEQGACVVKGGHSVVEMSAWWKGAHGGRDTQLDTQQDT